MRKLKVFIIVLNYNGGDDLKRCLDSVYKLNYPNFEVVVVDNDSDDDSFEKARRRFRKFHFIKNSRNLGFSAGNNVAIKWALEKMADYVFLLNNDAVVEKNVLSKLVEVMEGDEKMGIVSPVIYEGDGKKIWFAGGKINWWKMRTCHRTFKSGALLSRDCFCKHNIFSRLSLSADSSKKNYVCKNNLLGESKILKNTDYITGCAILVRREVFAEIGLLDEDFFLYYEDADFSWRARRAKFDLGVVVDAKVHHFEKSSENPEKIYWLVLSGILFFKKNAPWYWRPYLAVYLFLRKLKNKYNLIKNPDNKEFLLVKKAYLDSQKR